MIDVLQTNKLASAATGISVEARQTAGKPTAGLSRRGVHPTICALSSS